MSYNGIIFNSKKIIGVDRMKEMNSRLPRMDEGEPRQNYLLKNHHKIFLDKFNAGNFSKKSHFYSYHAANKHLYREVEGKSSLEGRDAYCCKNAIPESRAKYNDLGDNSDCYFKSSHAFSPEESSAANYGSSPDLRDRNCPKVRSYKHKMESYDSLRMNILDSEIERCLSCNNKLNSGCLKESKVPHGYDSELSLNSLMNFASTAPGSDNVIHLERFLTNNIYSLNNSNKFSGMNLSYFIIVAIIAKHIGFQNKGLATPNLFRSCFFFLPRTLVLAYILLKRYLEAKKIENTSDLVDLFFICCVVSYKTQADYNIMNRHLVQNKEFSLCRINYLEALLLNSIDYNISADEEQFKEAIREISIFNSYL